MAPLGLAIAVLLPSLAWLALDRSVWPWDQAWFARHTVELYEALRSDPRAWVAAMLQATPLKPPVVAWIGQFFVPVGAAIGNVSASLLLSVWITNVAALALVFRALMEMTGQRARAATAGLLFVAAAPIFVGLATQYLAEAAQTLAVAWFVFILGRARAWGRSELGAHLVAASAFAMLAKTTSPVFCAAPGVVALFELLRSPRQVVPGARTNSWPWWALASALTLAAVGWYWRNFETVVLHVTTASLGPVAELYGKRDTFPGGVRDWWLLLRQVFALRVVGFLIGALALVAGIRRLRRNRGDADPRLDVGALAGLAGIVLTIAVFALSPVREPRYLAPLLPLAAVAVCWSVVNAGHWAIHLLIAALGVQLVLAHSTALGLWTKRPAMFHVGGAIDPEVHVLNRDPTAAAELAAVVQRTCGHAGFGALNVVGVDVLRFSGHALTYAAAKERLAGRAGRCHYDSFGFDSVERARAAVAASDYVYWITFDPRVRPVPPHWEFGNRSAPFVFRQLTRKGVLQPEPWSGPPGILIYRFVEP